MSVAEPLRRRVQGECIPSREAFCAYAESATLIPVYREIIADVDTPVSALVKLGESPYRYLLESVEGGDRLGRYSFVGNTAKLVVSSRGRQVTIGRPAAPGSATYHYERRETANPLEFLRSLMRAYRPAPVPGLPRFYGGAVGYLSYDMVRFIERLPDANPDELDLPEAYFIVSDTVLIFDNAQRTLKIVANAHVEEGEDPSLAYDRAVAAIDEVLFALRSRPGAAPLDGVEREAELPAFTSNFDRDSFERAVERCLEYIRAGDVFQVVLSQRFRTPFSGDPFNLYRVLRTVNPSPYMFFLHFGELALVGSSPEVMVRCEDGIAQLRPIAGTRRRGRTAEEDRALEKELLEDAKERAEHVMLVDLGRNDLGRVCEYGSVRVDELMTIERYSHVMHIVSNITGKLAPGKDPFDLLRATFPAGTVSGAPKIRAMEIIDELEPSRRGPYAGVIGYFGFSGNMDSCITIRTVIVKQNVAYVQAGAGIVADSSPAREYEETLNKARGMLKAIAMAEGISE